MTRRRPSALDEFLATPNPERDQFLGRQIRDATPGDAIRIHVMSCPLARGKKRCDCAPVLLVAGARA